MSTIDNISGIFHTHRIATNTKEVFAALVKNPDEVYYNSSFSEKIYPINTVASGPFTFKEVGNFEEIEGVDLINNNKPASLRVINKCVEVKNYHHNRWFKPEMDTLRIYIPV